MTYLLARIPWFVSAPVVAVAAVLFAGVGYYLASDYFERTFLDEEGFVFERPVIGEDDEGGGDGGEPDGGTDEPVGQPSGATLIASGEFQGADSSHRGSGQAYLLESEDGELILRFENFSVTNGPDLRVVLTREAGGDGYDDGLELGGLRATDGNFNYEIPGGTDLSEFAGVLIWCEPFRVLFSFADFTFEPEDADSPGSDGGASEPTQPADDPDTPTGEAASATLVAFGEFQGADSSHRGSGQAYLLESEDGELILRFEDFSVTNGPDLRVVLTREAGGGGYDDGLELGGLRATDGNFNYTIPAGTDLSEFRAVIIWCEPFAILFAFADFEFEE